MNSHSIRRSISTVVLLMSLITPIGAFGAIDSTRATIDQLLRLSPGQFEAVYKQCPGGTIPAGRVRGWALFGGGRSFVMSRAARVVWQGKEFDASGGRATNRFFGVKSVPAQVYAGASWLDGGPTAVLDYSQTSRIYARYRDEIRPYANGIFLGVMYDRTTAPPKIVRYFILESID